jgi:hypothetical protein
MVLRKNDAWFGGLVPENKRASQAKRIILTDSDRG